MVETCMEQGTKAEIECAMKTTDIDKLEDCSPQLPSTRIAGLALGLCACFVDSGGSGTSASGSATAGSGTADASSTGADGSGTSTTSGASGSATTSASSGVSASEGSTGGSDATSGEGSTTEPASTSDATSTSTSTSTSTTGPLPTCGNGEIDGDEGCDDGNMVGGDGCSALCEREWRVVFVSSKAFNGDHGGLDGADAKCQVLAEDAGLPGEFKAWLSTPGGSPSTRFTQWKDRYVRVDGVPVAFDYKDLVDGSPLLAPITVTEQGMTIAADTCNTGGVWTATSTAGDFLGEHCSGWSSASKLIGGAKGLVSSVTLWTEASCAGPCEGFGRLYCFEQ
ncbi:MAG: hypothetical protein H6711_34095 [Myxococcales bacterium]|nr:hypothetical protein [Myxococcales bacterium]